MKSTLVPQGVSFQGLVSTETWLASLPILAATAISEFLGESPDAWNKTEFTVPAAFVARWSEPAARQLGLPPNCPLAFDIRLTGALGKPGARITVRWLQPGRTIAAKDVEVSGLWLNYQGQHYRVNSPVYDVMRLIEAFNQCEGAAVEEQFRIWARIRETLGDKDADQLTDRFLRSFRVITASALTFSIRTDEKGDVQLDPVLLTDSRDGAAEVPDKVRALSEADEALFPLRLDQLREGVPAFPLNHGTYVVADEPLQKALMAVRRLRQSPAEQRKRAAMFPEAVIREMLGAAEDEATVFVETEKFSERVLDVGEWAAPILPWIKIEPQQWGAPHSGGIRIGGKEVALDEEIVRQARPRLT